VVDELTAAPDYRHRPGPVLAAPKLAQEGPSCDPARHNPWLRRYSLAVSEICDQTPCGWIENIRIRRIL
jgi:hypothetical protein